MAKRKATDNGAAAQPKASDLPGMEDRAIRPLHDLALQYAAKRDERMKLLEAEVDLKSKLRDVMKKHNRTHYAYDGVEVTLEPPDGVEKVKVKVARAAEDGDD